MIAGTYWMFWIYLMIALLDICIYLIQYFKTYIKYSQVRKKYIYRDNNQGDCILHKQSQGTIRGRNTISNTFYKMPHYYRYINVL